MYNKKLSAKYQNDVPFQEKLTMTEKEKDKFIKRSFELMLKRKRKIKKPKKSDY